MGRDTAATICADVSENLRERAEELARNVLTMEAALIEARKQADTEPLIVEYDNGGGQSGIRKNPFWEAYAQMFNTFSRGLAQLANMVEGGNAKPEAKSKLAELRVIAGDLKKAN